MERVKGQEGSASREAGRDQGIRDLRMVSLPIEWATGEVYFPLYVAAQGGTGEQ